MKNDFPPHIPVLRLGRPYESLEVRVLADARGGAPLAGVSQANAGLIRRDLRKLEASFEALRRVPAARLLEICAKAGELFRHGMLPLGEGAMQSPQAYIEQLSAGSGLPHVMCRANAEKIERVLRQMPAVLCGLTRGLDPALLDEGLGEQAGVPLCYHAVTQSLGAVLPNNSPGVHTLWLPAVALKIPVVLKPGASEPWTPYRIIQALIAAGCPAAAFGFYPTDHEGARALLDTCGRALLFGDERTTAPYAARAAVQVHGPGRSKVLIGEDEIERWPRYLDVLLESILANGGRSCINASAIVVPKHGEEIAEALAERIGPIQPRPAEDPEAQLAAFVPPRMAENINAAIEAGLAVPGARDVTAARRNTPRLVALDGAHFLRPTLIRCESFEHPLANREFLFPYASVVEVPQARMLEVIGPSLVVSAITRDAAFIRQLVAAPEIGRLNLGPAPTVRVRWDQPHEGNLFEFLYRRRAFQRAGW